MGLVYNRGTTTKRKDNMKKVARTPEQIELQEWKKKLRKQKDRKQKRVKLNIKKSSKNYIKDPIKYVYVDMNKPRLWYAYLLLLENDKYYIGITGNVKRRFETHSRGKGAQWTAKHKPVSILEVRTLGVMTMSEAAMLEDEMYREFLPVYGMKLRGGSFCSVSLKPTKK